MTRSITQSISAVLLIGSFGVGATAQQPKDILFFGNSFTFGRDSSISVPVGVRTIADAAGHPEPNVVDASFSSADLDDHLSQSLNLITDLPMGEFWEAVVMQERSTKPTTSHPSGNPTAFRQDALELYGQVANHSPDVEAVFFETWARAPGHEFYTDNPPIFPGGPAQMQAELRMWYGVAGNDIQTASGGATGLVAPVGDAWEVGNWNNLHASDLFHAQNRGTLLASLVIYGTIYGERVEPIDISLLVSSLGMHPDDEIELKCYADAVLPVPDLGPADLDVDGDVDEDDYEIWETAVGLSAAGDIDGDGDTDGDDYLIWQRDFTGAHTSDCGTVLIPEPSCLTLLLLTALSLVPRWRATA